MSGRMEQTVGTMSWVDKMKKVGKSVVDSGAKTMLKVSCLATYSTRMMTPKKK